MKDIERLKQIAKKENAEWLGLSNIKAINNIIKENIRLKYQDIPYLEGTIKGYKARIEELKKQNTELKVLEDDLKDKRIVYVDTPEFEENYIPKSVIRDKIEELVNKIDGTNKGFMYACEVDLLEELIGEISKTKQEYWNKYDD